MSSELLRKNKQKPQKFFDKYRAKLAMAATVLTLATPAAIQVVQEGEFNPLAAIQAVSGDDISKEISTLKLSLVNTDGSEITNSTVNPYLKYRLNLKTESNITFGDNLIEVGDFFYINLPQELDYSAIQQMEASTTDFKYSIKVVDKDGQKQLRVEINDIMNLPFNAFKTEMTLPVTFADKTNGTVTLDANVANVQSNQQALTIKGRETKDISAQTGVTLQVMDSKFDSEITSPVDSTAVLGLQLTFDIGTNDLMPGDTFTVKLPTQLEYVDGAVVNIPNPEMQVVGEINNNDKTMTFEVLRVPQGTGNPKALVAQFATSFNALAIPEAGGNVTLTATTAKNSNSKTIKVISQEIITAKNDITNEVNTLTLTVTDGNGNNVKDSFVNPYKKYGMVINVDMGTKFGDKQVKPGDYIDIVLPSYMDYSGVGEMVNDTPTFKSVGTIINGTFYGQSVKVLRTLIKQVPRAGSNTVSFGFNLTVPFDIEKVRATAPKNGIRYLNLLLQTEKASTSNLLVKIKDLNEPEPEPEPIQPSTDGEFVSPHNRLFYKAGFKDVLRAEYIGSEFWLHVRRKNDAKTEIVDQGLYAYSVYTLVKVEKSHLAKDDYLASNVDPTKKHWSASRGEANQPDNSKIPNAGPENYINTYCMSKHPFRFTERRLGDDTPNHANYPHTGTRAYVPYNNRMYRYKKYRFDDYFYRPDVLNNLGETIEEKTPAAVRLQNVMAHSYPFVSEQEMREYFGFADHIKLSDIVAATQQIIWDILYINPLIDPKFPDVLSSIEKWPLQNNRYTLQLDGHQLSTAYNPSNKYIYEAGRQMLNKQNIDYKTAHKVEIESTSFNQSNNELTVNLSRAIDSSETANLTISANGKTSIPIRVKPNQTTYTVKVSDLIDGNSNKDQISISLEVTDKNGDVEFYIYSDQHAYQDPSKSQDVISCEMNPKNYSDQTSIEIEKPNTGRFEFVKYQTGTQYTIVGAEFELTNNSTGEKFTAVADLDGVVSFDKLPSGAYILKETKAPEGYLLIEKEYQVTVGQDGNATLNDQDISAGIWSDKYEISNPEIKVEIIKQEAGTEIPLTGAVFQVGKVNGASEGYPKTFDTRDNSSFIIERLTDGEYTIAEIKAPEGYVKTEEIKKFTVNNGEVKNEAGELLNGKDLQIEVKNNSIQIDNHPKPPELIVKKVNQNGEVLPAIEGEANSGAEFTLRESQKKCGGNWGHIPDTEQQTRTLTIDTDGQLRFENLSKDVWYILTETKAPTDYEGTEKQWNVKVESDGSIEISEVAVKRVKTPVKNIKNDDIQKTIQLVDGLLPTLSQKPKSVMKEFKEEQVSVKEAKKQEAKIDGSTITIVNQKLGKFDIEKISTLKEKLAGAEFKLTKKDDSSFTPIKKTTPKSGLLTFDNLLPGTYILTETKAPEGYEKTSDTWEIKVTNNGETILLSETGEKIINTGADFSSGYNGILNMASKVMSIDTENKTFTQYIYVNNYKSNKVVWFGENHFKPVANIELPKFNNAETISYKIYKVPFGNVSELQSFEGTKTKEEFPSDSAIVSNINRYEGYTNLEVEFNTALSPKNSYYDANAAIIEVTAKYEGNEINTNNSFQYMNPKWDDKSMETREVSTTNYVKLPNVTSEEVIEVPLTIINKRPETPEPKPGEGKVVINKLGLGKPVAGAKFKLSYGKIGEIDTTKDPIYGVENNAGEIIFNQLKPGIYTLEEESAPEGYEKTDRTWTIIIYSSGVTEAIENPSNGSLQPEERTGSNRNSDLTVVKDNFTFTVYPYGDSNGSRDASTIYPNNGGLMDVAFELDFKSDTKKLLDGDYFTLDIPEYMHDHGINPANVNEHIIINGRKEPIAIGKMVDMDGNRVMKYTFTEYAASMKHVILKGNLKLSIDTSVVTDDASNKQYDFNLIDQKHIKGSINVEYPDFGTEYTDTISLMSTITQKDNKNQTFEYYIYVNPLKRTGNKGTTLEINDFRNGDPYVPGNDSVANITSIRIYDATNVKLPKSFAVAPLIDNGTLKDLGKEYFKQPISKPNDGHTYTVDFGNLLYRGKSYVVKVTGTMDSQGDYLALSSKLKGTYTQKDIWHDEYWHNGYWHNGYWYDGYWENGYWENGYWEQKDLDNPTYLITNNHTYVRSSELAIIGHYKDNYPVLDIANKPKNKAKIKITKIDAQTEETIIDNNHKTNACFGITTTPNPVANDDLTSKDILNGQAFYLDNGTYIFDNDTEKGNNGPGFKPGQYYLWEMRAPKDYAKLLDVIPFYITELGEVIMPSKEVKDEEGNVEYVLDKEHPVYNMITIEGSDNEEVPTYSFNVKNQKTEYPETGSIGSIIFYVIGLTGMIGSAWMFTKKQ